MWVGQWLREGLMFESAELGHKIDKASYRTAIPGLRSALLEAVLRAAERSRELSG